MKQSLDAHVKTLNEQGFTLLPDVVPPDECERLKAILEETHRRYAPFYAQNRVTRHRLNLNTEEKVVYNIHNKDSAFLAFIDRLPVFDVVDKFLRQGSYRNADPVILRQNTARTPLRDKPKQQLHIDSRLPGCPYPLMAVVAWILDDFTEENGATRVVPGSHRWTDYPEDGVVHPEEIMVCGRQGSAIIMDGGLWHGSGANRTDGTRWCMLSTYVRWFFKPAFDFNRNMPRDFYASMTERQRQVMGYDCNPPMDEFTRISARSDAPDVPQPYSLPDV